ncbi:MAG: hypothetical protein KW802_03705 [Candidatus Doudnabacteria bacterium]|nr:hypothetical protein [Candidatus Doudnabacteria bacterium]
MDEINQTTPVQPMPNNPKKPMNKWVALAVFVLVLGAAAAGAYYLKTQTIKPPATPTPSPQSPNSSPKVLSVNWSAPQKTTLKITVDTAVSQGNVYYKVGTVTSDPYAGKSIYVGVVNGCGGPCGYFLVRLIDAGDSKHSLTILKNLSSPLDNFEPSVFDINQFVIDNDSVIPELTSPLTLKVNDKTTLTKAPPLAFQTPYTVFDSKNLKLVYQDAKIGNVYTTPENTPSVSGIFSLNGFYAEAPDHNTWIYEYKVPFVGDDSKPDITWDNGQRNTAEYVYAPKTGCGASVYADVASNYPDNLTLNDLKAVGKNSLGDTIYEYKDSNATYLKNTYEVNYNPYDYEASKPAAKKSYDQFIASHPVFFWVDPFKRIIRFTNNEFQPLAECGKPVIYLYPQKTENVSVKLDPTGGFSYTEPVYNSGWNVVAKPNGELTNLADGKTYPYLFWEGRSKDIYKTPDKGFVVAQANVHSFLVEKLAKLGLNQKESADFIEYWEPYMQGSPYYFVTFMGNQVMDQIAPLKVSPKPDTVIRVLMDFSPLEKPIVTQSYEIRTPIRHGFTVVEWGGVKR